MCVSPSVLWTLQGCSVETGCLRVPVASCVHKNRLSKCLLSRFPLRTAADFRFSFQIAVKQDTKVCLLLDRCIWLGQQAVVLFLCESFSSAYSPYPHGRAIFCQWDCKMFKAGLPASTIIAGHECETCEFKPVLLNHVHLGGSSLTWLGELDTQIGEKTALYIHLSENEMNSAKASFSPRTGKTQRIQWT